MAYSDDNDLDSIKTDAKDVDNYDKGLEVYDITKDGDLVSSNSSPLIDNPDFIDDKSDTDDSGVFSIDGVDSNLISQSNNANIDDGNYDSEDENNQTSDLFDGSSIIDIDLSSDVKLASDSLQLDIGKESNPQKSLSVLPDNSKNFFPGKDKDNKLKVHSLDKVLGGLDSKNLVDVPVNIEQGSLDLSNVSRFNDVESLGKKFISLISDDFDVELTFLIDSGGDIAFNDKNLELIHQRILFQIQKGNEPSEEVYRYLAFYYFKSAKYYQGISIIENRLSSFENKGYFYNLLGNFYYYVDSFKTSIDYFHKALVDSDLFSVHFSLAHYYFEQHFIDRAILHLFSAEEYFKDYPEFLFFKAKCYELKPSYDKALFYYKKCLDTSLANLVLVRIAFLYYDNKMWELAYEGFNQDLDFRISDDLLLYKKSVSLFFLDRFDESFDFLFDILNLDKLDFDLSKLDDLAYDLFVRVFDKGIYDKFIVSIFVNLSSRLDFDIAFLFKDKFLVDNISDISFLMEIAQYYYDLSEYVTATIYLEKILSFNGKYYSALFLLAKSWYNLEDSKGKAINLFLDLTNSRQNHDEVNYILGKYYFNKGDYKTSLLYFEQILADMPENSDLYKYIARNYFFLSELDKASFYFRIAFKYDKNIEIDYLVELAGEYLKKSNYSKSIDLYDYILGDDFDYNKLDPKITNFIKSFIKKDI